MRRRIQIWWPVMGWALFIFLLSSLRGDTLPTAPKWWSWLPVDKLVHVGLFGVLSGLMMHALRRGHTWAAAAAALVAISGTAAYGAFDEWRQTFVMLRSPSIADWLADTIGAVLGAWFYLRYESRSGQKTHRVST
ncbi:MAG: VanZ family protein [Verrucomicrobiae bacterium]|nr:VanZ family protein [Verrucomicrobiae bacterium]MDW8343461.1 VanZ family protein [Verrucomicrobiae bacterium]